MRLVSPRIRDAEIWLVLHWPRLSDEQLALIIGANTSTVHNLRWRLRRRGWVCSVRYAPCRHCGKLATLRGASRKHAYHPWCRPDAKQAVTSRREDRLPPAARQLARITQYRTRLQAQTRQQAHNAGRRWTEDEEQIVLDLMDRPILETCAEVQRSFAAVSRRRSILRERMRRRKDDGEAGRLLVFVGDQADSHGARELALAAR